MPAHRPAFAYASAGLQPPSASLLAVTQLAHHGMIFVPAGFAAGSIMFGVKDARGGSAWGAGTLAGPDGSRQPGEDELQQAEILVGAGGVGAGAWVLGFRMSARKWQGTGMEAAVAATCIIKTD